MSHISDLPVVKVQIDYDYYTRPSDRNGLAINTHFSALPPFTTSSTSTGPPWSMDVKNGSSDGEPDTMLPSSIASCNKLEPLKHRSASAAYPHMISGSLAAVIPSRASIDENQKIFIPDAGHTHGQIKGAWRPEPPFPEQQSRLEASKRLLLSTATAIPRLLFRGSHTMSGGGIDPRLNSWAGVMPHAFLYGETPTTMWDVPRLQRELTLHVKGYKNMRSHFSSWSQMLNTALIFAIRSKEKGGNVSPKIAVLDTESMLQHVWHTTDLYSSGLSQRHCRQEYLVYGPVRGPKYHCVDVKKLLRIPRAPHVIWGRVLIPLKEVVDVSRKLATVLRPQNAELDTILLLTAKFVANYVCRNKKLHPCLGDFLYHARDALQALATREDARSISLAIPDMATEFSPALTLEVQILLAAENAVRVLGWTWRAPLSRPVDAYLRQLERAYCGRGPETTRKREGSPIRDFRPRKRQRLS